MSDSVGADSRKRVIAAQYYSVVTIGPIILRLVLVSSAGWLVDTSFSSVR